MQKVLVTSTRWGHASIAKSIKEALEKKYRETHSCSYFHDFQTRRLNIRYKDDDGKVKFAHSLNNTAIATPRILISIIENYQQADGSIKIPEVLKKYFNKYSITSRAIMLTMILTNDGINLTK